MKPRSKIAFSHADYTYDIEDIKGRNVVSIVDLNLGHMSVTNDIENVLVDIAERERITISDYMVVYRDSEGNWDGWSFETDWFVPLRSKSKEEAVATFINTQLNAFGSNQKN